MSHKKVWDRCNEKESNKYKRVIGVLKEYKYNDNEKLEDHLCHFIMAGSFRDKSFFWINSIKIESREDDREKKE